MNTIKEFFTEPSVVLSLSEYFFKPPHVIMIIITLLFTLTMYFVLRNKSEKAKKLFFTIFKYII